MMKGKYFLIIFIFLNIIVLSSVVVGKEDYDTDVTAGTDLIWVCNVLDEDSMEDIFEAEDWLERDVPDWDDYGFWEDIEQGSRMRWYILQAHTHAHHYPTHDDVLDVDINIDCIRLKFKLWKWTDEEEFDEDPDFKKARAFMHDDPEDIGSNLRFLMPYDYGHEPKYDDPSLPSGKGGTNKPNIFYDKYREQDDMDSDESGNWYEDYEHNDDNPTEPVFLFPSWGLPMWIPQDVDDYLNDMDFDEHRYDVDKKELTISARIKEQSFDFFEMDGGAPDLDNQVIYELPNEDIKWLATYNEQGLMSNFKLWNSDKELVVEFTLQTFTTPGYDIPIFFGVMAVSVIAVIFVIYFIMKKKR